MLSADIQPQTLNNQSYNQTFIDVTNGLSNNYVSKIVEDNYGFKWIATEGGLNRYDGKKFEVFKPTNTPALANENIEVVCKDNSGNLWVGTKSGGLTYYDAISEQFENLNNKVFSELIDRSIRINCIATSKDDKIFVGTWNNGLFIFDKNNTDSIVHIMKKSRISVLQTDDYGNVWIADGLNLIKYDPSEDRLIKVGSFGVITSIYHDGKRNRLWLGFNRKGVAYFDLEDYSYHETAFVSTNSFTIQSLAVDDLGRVFVGTWGQGLFVSNFSGEDFKKYSLLSGIATGKDNNSSYETILDIHLDENGVIWISTAFGGVVKMMPVNNFGGTEKFFQKGELTDNNIYALAVDTHGKTWIGTYGQGISYVENGQLKHLKTLPVTKINVIKQIEDFVFVGAREGLFKLPMKNPKAFYEKFDEKLQNVTALSINDKGRLWIGTQQNGLFYIDNALINSQLQSAIAVEDWPGGDRVSKFEKDAAGNLWIGTFKGLYAYDMANDKFLGEDQLLDTSLPSDIINDLYFDKSNNKLWLALSGGLVELDVDGVKVMQQQVNGVKNGLKNEFITSVVKSDDGNIWVGTALGLAKYLPERNVFENYGAAEGVLVHSFNIKSVSKNDTGQLTFGASNGIVSFEPSEITYYQADPKVAFTGLTIDGESVQVNEKINGKVILEKSLQYTAQIDLTHQDETFSFNVATLDYLGDENVQFSYRLLGFNDNWSLPSSNRDIRFTNLNPGNYQLEVIASRDNFHWSVATSKLIKIKAPPWATWYAYTFYALFILGVAFLINFIARKQAKLQAKLDVEQIAREKEHDLSEAKMVFFTNISHEFRTPLTLILSPITELLMDQDIKGKIRKQLTIVDKNASRLLQLINQLLDFRKSENGLLQLRVAHGDFANFAKEVFLSFKAHADAKGIGYTFKAHPKRIMLPFDRDKMEIVLVNLISNAFKYSKNQGSVSVQLTQDDNNCIVTVKDEGIGIRPEDLDKIFDRFYQIQTIQSARIMGSGIGLSLAKNIVLLHHGAINVSSEKDQGSIFSIHLPIKNDAFGAGEFITDFKNSDDPSSYIELDKEGHADLLQNTEVNNENPTILVVDDNVEIRHYLSGLLKEEGYNIKQAGDGVEAIQVANDIQPDLIISDVMMPEMDGITFCNMIKNDVNTSHIPVILLTARSSTVFEVSGLQTGAEDYIKKPFHPAILKTRVRSILENRAKIREYFVNKLRFEPGEDLEAPSTEEKFIQGAITLIEEHIHDAEFGIENLMDSLAMSKSTLYRKLKSLTGLSITAFIRSVKLKKAAELILTKDWKLNQIAYESGFNDYKYFKTCFQDHFGCLPSEYRAKRAAAVNG